MKKTRSFWWYVWRVLRALCGVLIAALRWAWEQLLKHFFRRYWYRNVYLRSEHWRGFRRRILIKYNYTCQTEGCGNHGPALQLHHLTYKNIGQETYRDVVPLCSIHHDIVERGFALVRKDGTRIPGYRKHA